MNMMKDMCLNLNPMDIFSQFDNYVTKSLLKIISPLVPSDVLYYQEVIVFKA